MTEAEIANTAMSAFKYQASGTNCFGGYQRIVSTNLRTEVQDLMVRNLDAFAVLMMLRAHHFFHDEFHVANAMAETMGGWRRERFAAARKALEGGWIEMVRRPSDATGPALYRWVNRSRA